MGFLPVNRTDMESVGWDELDFLMISGDAYVDHPSFGHAVISRILEDAGYRVGIIAQPDWKDVESIRCMGRPGLAVLIAPGVIDSMVNNYSASKNRRKTDRYSPADSRIPRPDRAAIVYTGLAKQAFKGIPVIIGGVEAGLRRFAHYDYWSDKVRRSILFDSKADILVYGPGEKAILEIADCLKNRSSCNKIKGTAYISREIPGESLIIPSYDEVKSDKTAFARAFRIQYVEQDPYRGRVIAQAHGDRLLVCNPPSMPLSIEEMDAVYDLPYMRDYHPSYGKSGGIKALEEVKFSITSHRGCPGGCSFCSIVFNQGRITQKRSSESILREVRLLTKKPDFKGYITDIGGPTANFREAYCKVRGNKGMCREKQCLYPEICENLNVSHREYLDILKKAGEIPGVKKIFVKSGVRYDYLLADGNPKFLEELCMNHISGQLKVAPEHASARVLGYMGKEEIGVYNKFRKKYKEINKRIGKKQYLVPYFITGHPGEE
ncbi:MAG: YgiQ family radical SAM protein, partial [Clostridia bacterium]|nr:YgiQ family radical SAM protein [Clostridia bacterium]